MVYAGLSASRKACFKHTAHLGSAPPGRAASQAAAQSRSQTHPLAPSPWRASRPGASSSSLGCGLAASSSTERLKPLQQRHCPSGARLKPVGPANWQAGTHRAIKKTQLKSTSCGTTVWGLSRRASPQQRHWSPDVL